MYMTIVAPEMPWEKAKVELWRDCSLLGEPGTKEKESNIQKAIFEKGLAV
ncbi:hypothetical protein [Effusibacillus consociatus]|uniref:Uncharacterized protein n=1 Tax=Effusibacillus consociatus TaxID=1117041 RepID=A0ABV9QAZ0_9BACL